VASVDGAVAAAVAAVDGVVEVVSAVSAAVAVSLAVVPAGAGETMTMTIDELVVSVQGVYGDDLACVVLFGSSAGRDYHGPESDKNALILVKEVSLARLRVLAPVVRKWMGVGNPPPLVLTLEEWAKRSDVFAMEYADLLERHRVVVGELPTEGISVRKRDLRLQLESEAMGKLVRFRRGLMSAGTDVDRLHSLLRDSLPSMMALLRATVHLHGEAAPPSSDSVCDRAAALAGFSAEPFRTALAARRGSAKIGSEALDGVVSGYLEALERLVDYVDAFRADD